MEDGMSRACSMHGDKHAYSILVGNPEGMKHWEDLDVDGSRWENNNGWILEKQDMVVKAGFMWLRIQTNSGRLLTIFRLHKILGIS
jgi:hypothetical protein